MEGVVDQIAVVHMVVVMVMVRGLQSRYVARVRKHTTPSLLPSARNLFRHRNISTTFLAGVCVPNDTLRLSQYW